MSSDIKRHREWVTPIYVKKLAERVGPTECARMVGVSTTTISEAINNNTVVKPTELAAQLKYDSAGYNKAQEQNTLATNLLVVQLPNQHMATITNLVNNLGGRAWMVEAAKQAQ